MFFNNYIGGIMFGLNEIVAINNIPEAKTKFMKGGLNATLNMGFGSKTYPEGLKKDQPKKEKIKNKQIKPE